MAGEGSRLQIRLLRAPDATSPPAAHCRTSGSNRARISAASVQPDAHTRCAIRPRSSRFGARGREFHPGLDLAAPDGSPVRAAADSSIVYAGRYSGYRNMIDVQSRGDVVTRYAHLSIIDRGIKPGKH